MTRAVRTAGAARISLMIVVVGRTPAPFRKPRGARVLKSPLPIRLADGELGNRTRGSLRFNARKAGANQRTVQSHRFRRGVWHRIFCRLVRRRNLGRRVNTSRASGAGRLDRLRLSVSDEHAGYVGFFLHGLEDLVISGFHQVLPLARNLAAFIGVFRVACGATRQSDFVAHHGDNRVIGETTLARTIVVQNVTKP